MRSGLTTIVLGGALLVAPTLANARTVRDERYGFDLTWNAAVRFIRVDMRFPITERDRDSGFVLFTFTDNGRTTPGSLEIIRADVEGAQGVRVVVSVSQMPTYVEHFLLTRLDRKLHDEYGEPPPAPRHAPSVPAPDPDGRSADAAPHPGGDSASSSAASPAPSSGAPPAQ